MSRAINRGQVVPSKELQNRVRALVEREGIMGASKILKISRQTVTALLAGVGSHIGTITLAEIALASREGATNP